MADTNGFSANTNHRRRGPGRPFPPNVSGNPGGRPKGLAALVRDMTHDGVELVELQLSIMRGVVPAVVGADSDTTITLASVGERMRACEWLADRGFSKVSTETVASVLDTLQHLVGELVSVIDDEPSLPPDVALRLRQRWQDIVRRY